MNESTKVTESSIQTALCEGYITQNEARHMLKMYVTQKNLAPLPSHHNKVEEKVG